MTIKIEGLAPLNAKLNQIARLEDHLDGPARQAGQLLSDQMKVYPPPPPASTYDRTGRLRGSWGYDLTPSGAGVVVSSTGAYGPSGRRYERYVQGPADQAAIHQGRWQTTRQVLEKQRAAVIRLYRAKVKEILGS